MNLQIEVRRDELQCLVEIKGEIDAYTAPGLKSELVPIAEKKGVQLTIDLSNVSYIDSTGLGVLVGTLKLTRKNNGTTKLVGLNDRITRLFKITGLNEIMDIRG